MYLNRLTLIGFIGGDAALNRSSSSIGPSGATRIDLILQKAKQNRESVRLPANALQCNVTKQSA